MDENWGYGKLKKSVRARSITEMKHTEKLIERILFLEGTPIVGVLNKIHIGAGCSPTVRQRSGAEMTAVTGYNHAVKLAAEVGDNATPGDLGGKSFRTKTAT